MELTLIVIGRLYLGLARTIYIWCIYGYFGRESKVGNYHMYGHIRCIYIVLANPSFTARRSNTVYSNIAQQCVKIATS